jgi:hypothetical protein
VALEAPAAKFARPIPVRGARDVDLPGYAPPNPTRSFARGYTAHVNDFTDKFVARGAAKRMVSAENFYVGVADSGEADPDQRPAGPQLRQWLQDALQFSGSNLERQHSLYRTRYTERPDRRTTSAEVERERSSGRGGGRERRREEFQTVADHGLDGRDHRREDFVGRHLARMRG